jgi:hypothetical protein
MRFGWVVVLVAVSGCGEKQPPYDRSQLSFFVTSQAAGTGSGNIGGIAGADAHCQALAITQGSKRTWRAYLSAVSDDGTPLHARDRIGGGPWTNANGALVATSLDDLHGSPGPPQTALSYHENGQRVGRPHDIMTGSNLDGTLAEGMTCGNWKSTAGKTWLGHSNRIGSCCGDRNTSWNSAHESQGCSSGGLASMGGASYFYCFAID